MESVMQLKIVPARIARDKSQAALQALYVIPRWEFVSVKQAQPIARMVHAAQIVNAL